MVMMTCGNPDHGQPPLDFRVVIRLLGSTFVHPWFVSCERGGGGASLPPVGAEPGEFLLLLGVGATTSRGSLVISAGGVATSCCPEVARIDVRKS